MIVETDFNGKKIVPSNQCRVIWNKITVVATMLPVIKKKVNVLIY